MVRVNLFGFFLNKRIQLRLIVCNTGRHGFEFDETPERFAWRVWQIAECYAISFPVWCEP